MSVMESSGHEDAGGMYMLARSIVVFPEVIVIACCSRCGCGISGSGSGLVEYWMELWIRNAIPPPIPPPTRSCLTMLWFGVLMLLREVSLVSCSAAMSIPCSSIKWRISWSLLLIPLQLNWRIFNVGRGSWLFTAVVGGEVGGEGVGETGGDGVAGACCC